MADAASRPHHPDLSDFEAGLIVGLLIGEGSFGGDGRQPQVTLRMHTDHEVLFRWLHAKVPGSRLYGPYSHGGRSYFQWMVRGAALREGLLPLLDRHLTAELDARACSRLQQMRERYRLSPPGEAGSTTTRRRHSSP